MTTLTWLLALICEQAAWDAGLSAWDVSEACPWPYLPGAGPDDHGIMIPMS